MQGETRDQESRGTFFLMKVFAYAALLIILLSGVSASGGSHAPQNAHDQTYAHPGR